MTKIGEPLELPETAPVMVLPNTVLFPQAPMPLFIFEPRYRAMLATALAESRVLCVALMKPGVTEAKNLRDFHHTAGLGLIRACVGHEDGTSHLILQGMARVRFTGFLQRKPFIIAEIEELKSRVAEPASARLLAERAVQLSTRARESGFKVPDGIEEKVALLTEPGLIADLLSNTFLTEPAQRQDVLEELEAGRRLDIFIRHLKASLQ